MVRRGATVLLSLTIGLVGLVFVHRHQQLVSASSRAQDRIASLERSLSSERNARNVAEAAAARCAAAVKTTTAAAPPPPPPLPEQADCDCEQQTNKASTLLSPPPPTPVATPPRVIFSDSLTIDMVREAARIEMREALLRASRAGSATEAVAAATAVSAQGATAAPGDAELEAARFLLREAIATENPGWCHCPPAPNVTRLCAALSPPTLGACELRVASARSEADSLRSALLEANSRALEASERAAEDILVKKATRT